MELTSEKYQDIYNKYNNILFKIRLRYPSINNDDIESAKGWAIWKAFEQFDISKGQFITLLTKIMTNQCNDILKKQNVSIRTGKFHANSKIDSKITWKHIKGNYLKQRLERVSYQESNLDLPLEILSKMEKQVILDRLEGYLYKEIALRLGRFYSSDRTATKCIQSIFERACNKLRLASEYRKYRV